MKKLKWMYIIEWDKIYSCPELKEEGKECSFGHITTPTKEEVHVYMFSSRERARKFRAAVKNCW